MPTHEQAKKQLEAAQAAYEATLKVPDEDNFPVGTVLKWTLNVGAPYERTRVAIKVVNGPRDQPTWWMVGLTSYTTWDYLYIHIAKPEVTEFVVATAWESHLVDHPEPDLEVLPPEESGYRGLILRDPRRNIAWELVGTRWERRYED